MSTFSDRLRDERKRLDMNQTEMASIGGVQKQAQVNYESGERSPNGEYLAAIAAAGADVLYIITGDRKGPEPETLTSEERVMLDYFRQASAPVRKAALGALLSSESSRSVRVRQGNNTGAGSVQVGISHGSIASPAQVPTRRGRPPKNP